jgi:hypothetical protein
VPKKSVDCRSISKLYFTETTSYQEDGEYCGRLLYIVESLCDLYHPSLSEPVKAICYTLPGSEFHLGDTLRVIHFSSSLRAAGQYFHG